MYQQNIWNNTDRLRIIDFIEAVASHNFVSSAMVTAFEEKILTENSSADEQWYNHDDD